MWCGDRPLKEEFPFLFNLALNKDAWVVDCLVWVNDSYSWDVDFGWNFQDWEFNDALSFLGRICNTKIYRGEVDHFVEGRMKGGILC